MAKDLIERQLDAERKKLVAAQARINELMRCRAPTERGWICRNSRYGVWFISRAAVIADWRRDQKEHYGRDNAPVDDEAVDTWFREQISWCEVALHGLQIERPDMAAFEESFLAQMRDDTDWADDWKEVRATAAASRETAPARATASRRRAA